MFSVWTTSAYHNHSKHCTGRYRDTREDQVDQERTGGVQSTKTYKRWGWEEAEVAALIDTDGVGVWPNVSSWMRDESRSRSRSPMPVIWPEIYTLKEF